MIKRVGRYRIEEYISKGSFGKVYKASKNGQFFAIKQIPQPENPEDKKSLNIEINSLIKLNHPNIVKLYEVLQSKSSVFLIMQYCSETLASLLKKNGPANEFKAYEIMKQIVQKMTKKILCPYFVLFSKKKVSNDIVHLYH